MGPSGQTTGQGPLAGEERDEMDQDTELTKRLQEMGQDNAVDERATKSKERGIDPSLIRTVNWSRRRKRNKGLWKRTRGGGGSQATVAVDQIRKMLGGS